MRDLKVQILIVQHLSPFIEYLFKLRICDVQWRSHGAHGGHVTDVPLHPTSVRPDRVIRANPRRKLGVPPPDPCSR
jgi:hypothetical protein